MRTVSLCKAALLGATSFVAACGGGSKSVLSPGANGLPYSVAGLTADVGTMTTTYSGLQFRADNSVSAWQDDNAGTVSLVSSGSGDAASAITIISNSQIIVDGVTFTRQPGTPTSVGGFTGDVWTSAGGVSGIFALSGDPGAPTVLNSIFFGYLDQNQANGGNTDYSDTFLISGFETNPNETNTGLPNALPTASYAGPAALYLRNRDGTIANKVALIENAAGTNLTANFGTSTLTGTISGQAGGADNALGTGQVVLTVNTALSGNGFSNLTTGFTSANAAITLNGPQAINGNFFGQNAAEIGGVLNTGIANNGGSIPLDTYASGFFLGN